MSNFKLTILLRISIVLIAFLGLLICVFWYPFSVSLTTMGTVSAEPTVIQNVEFWVQLSFFWLTSLPCFIVLAICWSAVGSFQKNRTIFVDTVSIKCIDVSKILMIDLAIFLMGNIVFVLLEWNVFFILYMIIATIGLVVAFSIYCIAKFIQEGTLHRENCEGLI